MISRALLSECDSRGEKAGTGAKAALRFPDVFEYLADGRLSVTTASVLAPHLAPETAARLLAAAAFRSRDEIVGLLAERSRTLGSAPVALDNESVVQASSTSLAPVQVNSLADLCAPPGSDAVATEHAAPHAENSRRGRVVPCATGDFELQMRITADEHEVLRKAQSLIGHAVPSGDPALVVVRALQHYLAHLEKQRFGVKPGAPVPAGTGRGIPKPLVRLVWDRDGARCTFLGTDGHRCEETRRLELDHITPVAMGGETTPENLRVLCRAHNQIEAERVLGKEHVQGRREIAHRERAKAKGAARASRKRATAKITAEASVEREKTKILAEAGQARTRARDVVKQARYNDIRSALRGERRARSTA